MSGQWEPRRRFNLRRSPWASTLAPGATSLPTPPRGQPRVGCKKGHRAAVGGRSCSGCERDQAPDFTVVNSAVQNPTADLTDPRYREPCGQLGACNRVDHGGVFRPSLVRFLPGITFRVKPTTRMMLTSRAVTMTVIDTNAAGCPATESYCQVV